MPICIVVELSNLQEVKCGFQIHVCNIVVLGCFPLLFAYEIQCRSVQLVHVLAQIPLPLSALHDISVQGGNYHLPLAEYQLSQIGGSVLPIKLFCLSVRHHFLSRESEGQT